MASHEVPDKFGNLEHLAVKAITEFLQSDGSDPSLREKARVAQVSLGTISRLRETESALAEYIRITQPNASIIKALPAKAG